MHDKRRHPRYQVDSQKIHGKMTQVDSVEILDISAGGIRIKADSRLNIGKEYLITLGERTNRIMVKGVVMRAELSGSEIKKGGEQSLIYTVVLKLRDDQSDRVKYILSSFKGLEKKDDAVAEDRRVHVRFEIQASQELTMSYPAQFNVNLLSLTGMLIKADSPLETNARIPMELSLAPDRTINFIGSIASCIPVREQGQELYDIGVEFLGLEDHDRAQIKSFIDYLGAQPGTDRRSV